MRIRVIGGAKLRVRVRYNCEEHKRYKGEKKLKAGYDVIESGRKNCLQQALSVQAHYFPYNYQLSRVVEEGGRQTSKTYYY